jgi:HEAT repeat protein
MNDGGYQVEVTPWQIAAQAKGLLARWDILQARNFAIEKLAEGQWQEVLAKANGFQKQGYLQAISRTPLEAVLALGKKLSSQNSRSSFESRMLWGIALKNQNLNWMKQVAGEAGARFSTDLMRQDLATENLPNDNAVELLKAALKNSNLASFSLQRMAAYIDTNETVAPLLFDYLADKDLGSSAARALSKTNSVQVQQQLQKLSQSEQPLTKARAIQALDWHQQNNSK